MMTTMTKIWVEIWIVIVLDLYWWRTSGNVSPVRSWGSSDGRGGRKFLIFMEFWTFWRKNCGTFSGAWCSVWERCWRLSENQFTPISSNLAEVGAGTKGMISKLDKKKRKYCVNFMCEDFCMSGLVMDTEDVSTNVLCYEIGFKPMI